MFSQVWKKWKSPKSEFLSEKTKNAIPRADIPNGSNTNPKNISMISTISANMIHVYGSNILAIKNSSISILFF